MSYPFFKLMGWISNITAIRDKWRSIDLTLLTADAIEQSNEEVVAYNKEQMNEEGVLSTGERISPLHGRYPGYSPYTQFLKRQKGQEWRFVTLRDSNEFQSKMFLRQDSKGFTLTSSDSKTQELIAYYGPDIFGLTSEKTRKTWLQIARPYIIQNIKRITGAR